MLSNHSYKTAVFFMFGWGRLEWNCSGEQTELIEGICIASTGEE